MDLASMAEHGYRRDSENAKEANRFLACRVPTDALVRSYYVAAPQDMTKVLMDRGMTVTGACQLVNRITNRRFSPGRAPAGLSAKAEADWRHDAERRAKEEAERFAAECNARYFEA